MTDFPKKFEKKTQKKHFDPLWRHNHQTFIKNVIFVIYRSRQKIWGTGSYALGVKHFGPPGTEWVIIMMSYDPFGIVMHCSISHGYGIIKDKQRNRCKNNQKLLRYDNDITILTIIYLIVEICGKINEKWQIYVFFPRLWRHNSQKYYFFQKIKLVFYQHPKTCKKSAKI